MATQTSLSILEQHTWASPLAPAMEPDEYVFVLSSLQPYVNMSALCQLAQHRHELNPRSRSIAVALSCMNQYEVRRACQEWKAIIVHIDPECIALQHSVLANQDRSYLWTSIQAVILSTLLTTVGLRQSKIIKNIHWPSSRIASTCVTLIGCLFMGTCVVKTASLVKAIPRGYDVLKIRNEEAGTNHFFLVRRDYKLKMDPRVAPMYLLSGLGLGTILLGTRIAFKIKRA